MQPSSGGPNPPGLVSPSPGAPMSTSVRRDSTSQETMMHKSFSLANDECGQFGEEPDDSSGRLSSELVTSSSSLHSSTSPTPVAVPSTPPISRTPSSGVSEVVVVKQRRCRLTKRRAMPPRSNSTPIPPDSPDAGMVSTPPSTSSTSTGSSGSLTGRVNRFIYTDTIQRRFISSFLRQNSCDAEVVSVSSSANSGPHTKKKLSTDSSETLPSQDSLTTSPSLTRSPRILSLANYKSSSVPSMMRRSDSKCSEPPDSAKLPSAPELPMIPPVPSIVVNECHDRDSPEDESK